MYPGSKIFKCHAAKLLVHMDDILFYVHEGKKKKPQGLQLIVYLSLEEWKEMSKTSVGT